MKKVSRKRRVLGGRLSLSKKVIIIMGATVFASLLMNSILLIIIHKADEKMNLLANGLTGSIIDLCSVYEGTLAMDSLGAKHFIADDPETKAYLKETIDSCYAAILTSLEELLESKYDKLNQADLSLMRDKIQGYYSYVQETLALSDEGNREEAYQIMIQEMKPLSFEFYELIETMKGSLQEEMDAIIEQNDVGREKIKGILKVTTAIYFVCILIALAVANVMIVNPLKRANDELKYLTDAIEHNRGDLSYRLTVSGKDEISQFVSGVNGFITTLENTIKKMQGVSNAFTHSFHVYEEELDHVFLKVENNSASMQQMSAGMQETDASMQQINMATDSIGELVDGIVQKATFGANIADSISQHAEGLKTSSNQAKMDVQDILAEIGQNLKDTIEQSQEVEKIDVLTNTILDITSQTNLLALNASIEAARAGEMGKGFAVVAEEIGHLAENSKNTASEIQQVSAGVITAVKELAENADRMLQFIREQVMEDYRFMVDSGKQYDMDAKEVNDIMKEFQSMAEGLNETVSEIVTSITSVTSIISESSQAVNNMAENSEELLQNVTKIKLQATENQKVVDELNETLNQFQ